MMDRITKRLTALTYLTGPLVLIFFGIVVLSLGVASLLIWSYRNVPQPPIVYYLTLQFLPEIVRSFLLVALGLGVLAVGIWQLSGVVVIPLLNGTERGSDSLVLGYRREGPPRIAVISGGAGMLTLTHLSQHVETMTCITPLHEPIEYYYRASGPFQSPNVHYVVPTPDPPPVFAELDDHTIINVMHIDHHESLAARHVVRLFLPEPDGENVDVASTAGQALTRPARDALLNADAILLGPGSLFESILPNFLLNELQATVQQSKARKIYICNLMTEPGLTSGFSVGDHIRELKRYGGFAPDYVLVNVQRIEADLQQIYASAQQVPVYLTPDELEETAVPNKDGVAQSQLLLEGSVIVEADLASSVVQYNASINNPGQSWTVRVLRHDPEKLTSAIMALLRRP